MKLAFAALAVACWAGSLAAQDQNSLQQIERVAPADMRWVTPELADHTDEVLFGQVWQQPSLSPRDRSLVTVSALIAGGHTQQLTGHLNRALDNGVQPAEIGGLITHLAFYTGWPNAVSALGPARQVLEARGINAAQMQPPAPPTDAERLNIVKAGAAPISQGPASRFTGLAQVSAPFSAAGHSRIGGATVHFAAGARTAWHRHRMGQTLIVTQGCGLVQREHGAVETICAGDVALISPNEKHWHGATATSEMTHVALSESPDVEWLELVSDAEYER